MIALVSMLLLSVHLLLLLRAQGLLHDPVRASALVLAAFLVLLGNVIGRLRPSYLLGIRTPWTLSSGAVWRRTHRLAGWLMVPSGLVALLLDFALPSGWALPLTIGLLLASTLAPAAMSYVWAHRTAV